MRCLFSCFGTAHQHARPIRTKPAEREWLGLPDRGYEGRLIRVENPRRACALRARTPGTCGFLSDSVQTCSPCPNQAGRDRMAWFARSVTSRAIDLQRETPVRALFFSARVRNMLLSCCFDLSLRGYFPCPNKAGQERMAWFAESGTSRTIDPRDKIPEPRTVSARVLRKHAVLSAALVRAFKPAHPPRPSEWHVLNKKRIILVYTQHICGIFSCSS